MPLVTEVWRECDPIAVTSGRYYRADFGVPPKTLHIYEWADANWELAVLRGSALRAWVFDGRTFSKLSPISEGPRVPTGKSGMYHSAGLIDYFVDPDYRRAVYCWVLGPRYARGFERAFASGEAIRLEPDRRFLVWVS